MKGISINLSTFDHLKGVNDTEYMRLLEKELKTKDTIINKKNEVIKHQAKRIKELDHDLAEFEDI